MEIKIKNFKLNVFRALMEQSLIVDNQLMFEFTPEMVRSCSFSNTKSFMKLWGAPLDTFLKTSEGSKETYNFEPFNMYILKGDLFRKFLSVHTSETVDLTFNLITPDSGGKKQSASITVTGDADGSNKLRTTFVMTTDDLIVNKIDDYSRIIRECTPEEDMIEFDLTNEQIQEIKRLIKKLHKSSADNTPYLSIALDAENKKITVNDKVFVLEFQCSETMKMPKESFNFNILKTDFIIAGNQNFSVFTNESTEKVIFGGRHAGAIIWCLGSKVKEDADVPFNSTAMDSTIESIDDIDAYLNDF